MTKKNPVFNTGDRVALNAAFLRSTGQVTGRAGSRRGTVMQHLNTTSGPYDLVRIQWDDSPVTALEDEENEHAAWVNRFNIVLVSRIAIDSALCDVPQMGFTKTVKGL